MSAVVYVDDSDLFHMALGTPLDEEFLQIVQSATNDWAGSCNRGVAQATEMLLLYAWLDMEEG